MSLFDEIADVPWAELHHAYGPATDVPDLLRALMSPEAASPEVIDAAKKNKRSVFDQVTWELCGNVFHQGTVWQVTATTVPFIAAILRDGPDDPKHKAFLIDYLHHLALGYPQDLFPDLLNPNEAFAEVEGLEDPGGEPDYEADDNRLLIWMRDSYLAVERNIEAVFPYLDADNDQVADAAIALCGSFPRCAEQTVPHLRRLVASEDRRGATAAVSLAVLEGPDARQLAETIATSTNPLTSLLGACAAVLADAENASTEIVTVLTRPLGELSETESVHASTLGTLVGRCLERLGPDYRDRAVAGICSQLVNAGPEESLSLTQSLLTLVFENPPLPPVSKLSATQLRALEAIRDHGGYEFPPGMGFGNYGLLLADWGLPSSAEKFAAWLRTD
ncbi:MAG: hypothetical protein ACR2PA_05025 [Hyphomicrobiaceae bacterium]